MIRDLDNYRELLLAGFPRTGKRPRQQAKNAKVQAIVVNISCFLMSLFPDRKYCGF
jgi:hypothetical protein